VLAAALRARQPGPYQVQAVIASLHANARTYADTDWALVALAYRQLVEMTGSPVVRLNAAVAIGLADGPLAGLVAIEAVEGLDSYHLLHATRGDLLARASRPEEAAAAFERASALTTNPAEQRQLRKRIDETRGGAVSPVSWEITELPG